MPDEAYSRKYRPMNISEYMGDGIRKILENRFEDEKGYPQTILLSGDRGCGKTSAARLIAKEYLCLSKENGHACGKCEMCLEVEEKLIKTQAGVECNGVTELDIATDNGKSVINDAIEDAMIEPHYPMKFKVVILDECHMATKQAQNSLLKVVEEPPPHLVFIFCTTNPEELLTTLRSRCQLKLEVKKPSVEMLAERLLFICQKESITTSMDALKVIAKKAERVPREALNLLESIAKDCCNQVTIDNIRERTGDVSAEIYLEFFGIANHTRMEDVLMFTKKLKGMNLSYERFIVGLTRFLLDSMYIKHGISLEEYTLEYTKAVTSIFTSYTQTTFDIALQIIEHANKTIGENKDDTKNELEVILTALRIGKLGLLEPDGLAGERSRLPKENSLAIGTFRAMKMLEQEEELRKSEYGIEVDPSILQSAVGKSVIQVKGLETTDLEFIDNDEVETDEDEETVSIDRVYDEDYLNTLLHKIAGTSSDDSNASNASDDEEEPSVSEPVYKPVNSIPFGYKIDQDTGEIIQSSEFLSQIVENENDD